MSRSLFSLLVPDFLESHFAQLEALERHLRRDRGFLPLQLNFGTHDVQVVAQRDGTCHVHCAEQTGLRHYAAQVAFKPNDPSSARATLLLSDRSGAQTVHLTGDAVFDATRVPSAFRAAHERMVTRITRLCAKDAAQLDARSTSPEGARLSAPEPSTDEAAAAQATQATRSSAGAASEKGFEEVLLERHNQPTLRFQGRALAQVLGPLVGKRRYVLTVYETPAGNQVAVREGVSLVPFEMPRVEAVKLPADTAERLQALQEFYGFNATARALYRALGVEPVETIE